MWQSLKRAFGSPVASDHIVQQPTPKPASKIQPQSDDGWKQMIEQGGLNECLQAFINAHPGSAIETLAESKIKKIARTLPDWIVVREKVSPTSSLGKYALDQLPLVAQTFSDWETVHSLNASEISKSLALEKMAAKANTLAEKAAVYQLAPEGSPVRFAMIASLKSQAKTEEEWQQIFEDSTGELERFAGDMMIELASKDVKKLVELLSFEYSDDSKGFAKKVLAAIWKSEASLAGWIEVAKDSDTPEEVLSIAIGRIVNHPEAKDKDFAFWLETFKSAEEGSDFEKLVIKQMIAKLPSDDPHAGADLLEYSQINDEDEFREKILEALRTMSASAFESWKKVYELADNNDDDDLRAIAMKKLVEGIDSAEKLDEVDELVDSDQKDDDFEEAFMEKARSFLKADGDLDKLSGKYHSDSAIFVTAVEAALARATTADKCIYIFLQLLTNSDWETEDGDTNEDLLEKALDRLMEVATDSELYIMQQLAENSDDFGDLESRAEETLSQRQSKS